MKKESSKSTFTTREVGVLIEDLKSQFKVFGEGLKALNTKVDGIAANQATTLERVTLLEITARKIQADIAEIKEGLKGHDKHIAHLEAVK